MGANSVGFDLERHKEMCEKFFKAAWLAICCALLSASSAFASHQQPSSMATEQAAIRTLMSDWVEAYKHLDAKRLAALEIPDVQTVESFRRVARTIGTK